MLTTGSSYLSFLLCVPCCMGSPPSVYRPQAARCGGHGEDVPGQHWLHALQKSIVVWLAAGSGVCEAACDGALAGELCPALPVSLPELRVHGDTGSTVPRRLSTSPWIWSRLRMLQACASERSREVEWQY